MGWDIRAKKDKGIKSSSLLSRVVLAEERRGLISLPCSFIALGPLTWVDIPPCVFNNPGNELSRVQKRLQKF